VGTFTETYDNKNVAGSPNKVMTPAGTIKDGSNVNVTANYNITFATSSNGTITALTINVTADSGQFKYWGQNDPTSYTYQFSPALISPDAFSGALTRAAGENVGPYAIGQGTLSLSANYSINYTGANFSILSDTTSLTFKGTDQGPNSTVLTDLSCKTAVSANLTNAIFGTAGTSATVTFTLTGSPAITPIVFTGTTDTNGNVTVKCPINLPPSGPPPSYTMTIAYGGSATLAPASLVQPVTVIANPHIGPGPNAGTLYTGSRFVWTTSSTTSTATLALSATIQDTDPCVFTDITKAKISFWVSQDGGATFSPVAQNLPVGLVDPSNHALGTASATSQYNLGKDLSAQLWIRVTVGGEYSYSGDDFDVPVVVAVPGQVNTVMAGGVLDNDGKSVAGSSGYGASGYLGTAASTTNEASFSGIVTYTKKLTNPQGQLYVTMHSKNKPDGSLDTVEHSYWVKSNSISGMNVLGTGPSSTVSFTAKYNLYETTGGAKSGIDSGGVMQFTFTPKNGTYTVTSGSGSSQSFTCQADNGCASIVVFRSGGGVWFSSAWGSVGGLEQTLAKPISSGTTVVQ
jgi:hypothetical protein